MNSVHSRMAGRRVRSLRGIDLNLFKVFDAIWSEGSLTDAGAKLGLTQPAVSHALSRLRAALDDQLFVRSGGRMAPTPFARRLIGDVRRSLGILEGSLLMDRVFDPSVSTATFRIALPQTHEAAILAPLYKRLAVEAPGVSITSSRISRRDFEAELASGGLDLVVDLAAPVGMTIIRASLFTDRLVVALRRDHPLLEHSQLSLDGYLDAGHVLVSSRRHGGGVEDFELSRIGFQRRIALRCQSARAAVAVVADTDLLCTLPGRQLAGLYGLAEIVACEVPFESRVFEPEIYWHARQDDDPANRWLRQLILSLF